MREAIPRAARLAAELNRGLRRHGTDPEDARTLLQTISAALAALSAELPAIFTPANAEPAKSGLERSLG